MKCINISGKLIIYIFLLFSIPISARPQQNNQARNEKLYNVGYTVLDFKYSENGFDKTLTVAVWYPTSDNPETFVYGGPAKGKVAVKGAIDPEGKSYPLLVFSHGYGGTGLGAVYFTEQLAARGWIVAAPDHHDKHSFVRIRNGQSSDFDRREFLDYVDEIVHSGPNDRAPYLYRLNEMQLVLDKMLISDQFGNYIDRDKIAVGGHSFGGYTALGVCGTIPERHDERVKAVLLFSTGAGGYLYSEEELSRVNMPSMYFLGERERNQMRADVTMQEIADKVYRNMSAPKYFLEVEGGNHFSFNNRFNRRLITLLLSGSEDEFEVIRNYSIAFLEKHIAGNNSMEHILLNKDSMLTVYKREP